MGTGQFEKNDNWRDIIFNEGANIKFTGCNTGGYIGSVYNTSIAQFVANETKRNVWAYVNCTTQISYDANGNVTQDWRNAVKHYQMPIKSEYNETVVNGYTKFSSQTISTQTTTPKKEKMT